MPKLKLIEMYRPTLSAAQIKTIYECIAGCGDTELIMKFQILAMKVSAGVSKPAYIKESISTKRTNAEKLADADNFDEAAFMKEMEELQAQIQKSKEVKENTTENTTDNNSLTAIDEAAMNEYNEAVDVLAAELATEVITPEEYEVAIEKLKSQYGIQ